MAVGVGFERGGDGLQRFVLGGGGQRGEHAAGGFGAAGDFDDGSLDGGAHADDLAGVGMEDGADGFAGDDALDHAGNAAVGDDGDLAAFGDDAGGFDLGGHAAAAAAIGDARVGGEFGGDLVDLGDELGAVVVGMAGVEAVDVGEQDEEVGVDLGHDQSGELVVVAEDAMVAGGAAGAIELERGDGVVLVDDGDDAELEQRVEGGAQVGVALGIEEVIFGEQDLGGGDVEVAEGVRDTST